MSILDIVLIVVIGIAFIFACRSAIRNKGKCCSSGCSGCCAGCDKSVCCDKQ